MSSCGCNRELDKAIAAAKATSQPSDTQAEKRLDIDLMYIDLSVCDRCQGTEQNLDEAIASVKSLLQVAGYRVNLNKIHVESEEQARALKFVTSPTIRINGHDIQLQAEESHCSSCSSLVDDNPVDCRSWEYNGKRYDTPPTGLLVEAIVMYVFDAVEGEVISESDPYELPDNLKRFFAARRGESSNSVASECSDSHCGC